MFEAYGGRVIPAFPPGITSWCYPFVHWNCVGTDSPMVGADVGMILGKWFKVDKWMDAPDSEKVAAITSLFTNVSG